MSATPQYHDKKHEVWRERSIRQRETTGVQDAKAREQNAWDFLQTIRNPQYIADRINAGEHLGEVVRDYNNVSIGMMAKFLTQRLGRGKWTLSCPGVLPKTNKVAIDWSRVDALREYGYSYRSIAVALHISCKTLTSQALRRRHESL